MKEISIPEAFKEMFNPKWRYRTYYGGRGGAKSESVCRALLVIGMSSPIRILCCREFQTSIADSVHKLLSDIIREHELDTFYTVTQAAIRGKNGTEFIFKGLRHNATEIKSMANIDYCFVEEAEKVSHNSWEMLIPTIRKPGSSITVVFNPKNSNDPTYERFVKNTRDDSYVRKVSYEDNPFFPEVLERERLELLKVDQQAYDHVWLGQFDTRRSGAVFAKQLAKAREEGRITKVPYDPSSEVFTAWDLGFSDATTIWWGQIVGRELRIIEYYENAGEGLEHYAKIVKEKPYNYMKYGHYLPHDANAGNIRGDSVAVQLSRLGIQNQVLEISNVEGGIEAVRQLLPMCVFDAEKTKDGVFALENYAYEWDEERQIFKNKPKHDWASNGADGFRYLAHAVTRIKGSLGGKPVSLSIKSGFGASYMGN